MRRLILALACLFALTVAASAQTSETRATLQSQNVSTFPPNTIGAITPQSVESLVGNLIASTGTLLDPNTFGGGTPLTFSVNPPIVAGASQFIPLAVTTTALPSLVIERSTNYSAGATTSPTLFIGTLVNVTNAAAFVDGIDSELEITANTGAGGGAIEAIRGRCVMDAGVTNIGCWGGSFVAQAQGSGTGGKGVESEVAQATVVAPTPPSIVIGNLNVSYLASSGLNGDGGKIVDAAFMVNPFSLDGFQAGFECPTENSAGTVVRYACFEGAETATFGLDLSLGHWANAAINATGFFVDNTGRASTTQLLLSAAGSNFISATSLNGGAGSNIQIQSNNGTTGVTGIEVFPSGSVQLPNALTYGGVTLANSVTGTGSMVLSAAPTFTGTIAAQSIAVQSNPTLSVGLNTVSFFGGTKTVNTAGVALDGIQIQVIDTAGWSGTGQNNFIEAIRTGAILSNGSTLGSAYGGIFVANDQAATNHLNLIGIEGAAFNYTETAVPTSSLNCSSSCTLSGSWLGGTGGTKAVDAIFMTNPYPGQSAAQSGFLAAGNGLIYAAFADISTTAAFGLDLAYATHTTGAIHIKNNEAIWWDTAAHAAQEAALYLDASNNFHIGQSAASVVIAVSTSIGAGAGITSSGPGGVLGNPAFVASSVTKTCGATIVVTDGVVTSC